MNNKPKILSRQSVMKLKASRGVSFLTFALLFLLSKPCLAQGGDFSVDLKRGVFNNVSVRSLADSLHAFFPALVLDESLQCRPVLREKNAGFYVDIERRFVVFSADFKGQFSQPDILGMDIRLAVALLGKPVHRFIPDADPLIVSYFYPADYGCYRIDYELDTRKIKAVAMHAKSLANAEKDMCLPNTY